MLMSSYSSCSKSSLYGKFEFIILYPNCLKIFKISNFSCPKAAVLRLLLPLIKKTILSSFKKVFETSRLSSFSK